VDLDRDMRRIYFLLFAVPFLLAPAAALAQSANCRADALSTATGPVLTATSGLKYELFPGNDLRVSGAWLPLDRLRICRLGGNAYEITDLDRKGEQIEGLFVD